MILCQGTLPKYSYLLPSNENSDHPCVLIEKSVEMKILQQKKMMNFLQVIMNMFP